MEHNLKNVSVKFPLGVITAVTGVSGSGKSTLIGDTLYPAVARHFQQFGEKPGAFKELRGDLDRLGGIEFVDQNPIGKSSRSNPVTYLKIYDDIRKLYSEQENGKTYNKRNNTGIHKKIFYVNLLFITLAHKNCTVSKVYNVKNEHTVSTVESALIP